MRAKDQFSSVEAVEKKLKGLQGVARLILQEHPAYVYISDAHISSQPQEVAVELLGEVKQLVGDDPNVIGFYVEALYDYADPASGDLAGGVIKWDSFKNDGDPTKYGDTVRAAVKLGIAVHGIDSDKPLSAVDERRMLHMRDQIRGGGEPIKIVLVGCDHLWNNSHRSEDLIHRMPGWHWVVNNEGSYIPPGFMEVVRVDNICWPRLRSRQFSLVKYYTA